jgi:formylglycine-generating enzyme required for sulfatase activity
MGNNPSFFKECGDNCPVENVSWNETQEFIKKVNQMGDGNYRLPTEAEWEYAARAGTMTSYSFGNDSSQLSKYGNFCDLKCKLDWKDSNQNDQYENTAPVKSYFPNAWGLYDMHGNVAEWCHDWLGKYPLRSVTNPVGPSKGWDRVHRGGGWSTSARMIRSAGRPSRFSRPRFLSTGFRLLRML